MPPFFLGLKLLSFTSIGCIGSGVMFLPMFYKNELGLGTDKIGLLYTISPFVSCLAFPFWTTVADRTKQHKKIMLINMTIAFMAILYIALVPSTASEEWDIVKLLLPGTITYSFFGYPMIAAMVDCVTMQVLADKKTLYGQQKAGCPIGVGTSFFLAGVVTNWFGPYAFFCVNLSFTLLFILTIACTDFRPYYYQTEKLPSSHDTLADYGSIPPTEPERPLIHGNPEADTVVVAAPEPTPIAPPFKQSVRDLLTLDAAQFLSTMGVFGLVIAIMQVFLYIFVSNDLHGSPLMVGMMGPLASSTEVVCFYFSKQIFGRLGTRKMLITAQVIGLCRCSIYILSLHLEHGAVWLATLTHLTHGIEFSLLWSAAVVQADMIAPEGLKARAQGLLNMIYNGLGGFGSLLGGYIYEHHGAQAMWTATLLLQAFGLLLYTTPVLQKRPIPCIR